MRMNAKTLKALKGSIKKWVRIVQNTSAHDWGADNCPLCMMFFYPSGYSSKGICDGCPVMKKTRMPGCCGSPYFAWVGHQESARHQFVAPHRKSGCAECLRLAKAELAFLQSLLPKKEAMR